MGAELRYDLHRKRIYIYMAHIYVYVYGTCMYINMMYINWCSLAVHTGGQHTSYAVVLIILHINQGSDSISSFVHSCMHILSERLYGSTFNIKQY